MLGMIILYLVCFLITFIISCNVFAHEIHKAKTLIALLKCFIISLLWPLTWVLLLIVMLCILIVYIIFLFK
jgi:hypothetical protein